MASMQSNGLPEPTAPSTQAAPGGPSATSSTVPASAPDLPPISDDDVTKAIGENAVLMASSLQLLEQSALTDQQKSVLSVLTQAQGSISTLVGAATTRASLKRQREEQSSDSVASAQILASVLNQSGIVIPDSLINSAVGKEFASRMTGSLLKSAYSGLNGSRSAPAGPAATSVQQAAQQWNQQNPAGLSFPAAPTTPAAPDALSALIAQSHAASKRAAGYSQGSYQGAPPAPYAGQSSMPYGAPPQPPAPPTTSQMHVPGAAGSAFLALSKQYPTQPAQK